MMPNRLRLLLFVLASLGAGLVTFQAAPAVAETRVLALQVEGDKIAPADRDALLASLQDKLRAYPDITVQDPPAGDLTDLMIDLECIDLDAQCLGRLGHKHQADKVVHVAVRPAGNRFLMRVRFVDAATERIAREKEVRIAKVADLAPALAGEVEAVFGKPPVVPDKGTLVVEASSPSAVIQVGPDTLGTGTATTLLPPGEYTVRVSQPGYEDVIKKVTVISGETTREQVTLVAVAPVLPPDKPPQDDDSDWVVWAVVGALVVGGAVAAIALTTDSGDDTPRGPALLGIDPGGAWRDPATIGGRK